MVSDGPRRWPALDLRFPPALPGAEAPGLRDGDLPGAELAAAILDDHSPTAIDDGTGSSPEWRVFFSTAADRDAAANALQSALGPCGLVVHGVEVEDENWAARSQENLRAIRVGDVVVSPPWDMDDQGERWRITILPSMGFGTGHHESTRLCLRALQHLSLEGARVIDVGTGSGVLAITAAAMGATRVVAIDHDRDAIEAARDGVDRNACAGRVTLRLASIEDLLNEPPANVVLANLTSAPLIRHAGMLTRLLMAGGVLVVSGFTADEEPRVLAAFGDLTAERRDVETGWCALTLRAAGAPSEIAPREQQRR